VYYNPVVVLDGQEDYNEHFIQERENEIRRTKHNMLVALSTTYLTIPSSAVGTSSSSAGATN
jgi:hypothetical protein